MNPQAQHWIDQYALQAHPEGGHFIETIASEEMITPIGRASRPLYSSILFMLSDQEVSHFHRLMSDEIWIFQDGNPLSVVTIDPQGKLDIIRLGKGKDEVLQAVVKAGMIFGSCVSDGGSALVGCIVSPGFLYEEFTLFSKTELLKSYPQHAFWIDRLGL